MRLIQSQLGKIIHPRSVKKRLLKVALIGVPNAGKSTLLNRLIEKDVSGVSNKVHTTRKNLLAVLTKDDVQLQFHDSPGVIDRKHLLRHKLEDTLLHEPENAATKCDLVAVIMDANSTRDRMKLNRGVLDLLHKHNDKDSILIMNKVDLVKDKRSLLDIGTRLTQGCIGGSLTLNRQELAKLSAKRLIELNLGQHTTEASKSRNPKTHPDDIGYKYFSQVFSISALYEDGVDELRDYLLSRAKPVEDWPHEPNFLTNQSAKEAVHEIIRGKILDYTEGEIPYALTYKYLLCSYDENGSLHVQLLIECQKRYAIAKVLGKSGSIISKIAQESKEIISRLLHCDVVLDIRVDGPVN